MLPIFKLITSQYSPFSHIWAKVPSSGFNPRPLSQNKLGMGETGRARLMEMRATTHQLTAQAASLGLPLVPGPVRPALPGSLEGRRRRKRVEMQDLEEELEGLGQGRAKQVSATGQERRKWGGGIVYRCVTLKAGLLKGVGTACSGQG